MVLRAFDRDLLPGDALQVFHSADGVSFRVEDRPLLDVQFHERAGLQETGFFAAFISDALELFAQNGAVDADDLPCVLGLHAARVYEGTHHIRGVAHAFLVRKRADCHGIFGLYACFFQALEHLEACQHAVAAIVLARVDDGVDVRACHNVGLALVFFRLPDAEQVADLVDRNAQSRFLHPARDEVSARLFGVICRQARSLSFRVDADRAEGVDSFYQSFFVDPDHVRSAFPF